MSGGTVSYTINIGANISKVKEAMKEVSQLLSSSNLDKGITSSYERKLGKLSNALLELENKASQPIKTDAELRDVERSIKKVTNLTSELGLSFKELQGKDLSKVFGDFTKPVQNLKDYIKEFDKLEKKYNEAESKRNSDRLAYQADRASKQREIELKKLERQAIIDKEPSRKKRLDDQISKLNAEKKALENTRDSLNRDIASPRGTINKFSKNDLLKNLVEADQALLKFKNDYKDLLDKNDILTKSKVKKEDRQNYDFEALRNQYKQLQANRQAALENAKPVLNVTQGDDVEKELDKYKTAVEKYKEISEQLNNTREQIAEKKKKASDLEKDKENDPTKAIDKEIADLEAAEGKLKKSLDNIDKSTKESKEKIQKSFNELKSSFKDITKNDSFDKLEYNEDNFKKLYEAAKNFSSGQFAEAAKQLQGLGISFENLSDNAGDLKGKLGPVFNEMSRTKEMSDDFEHLTWRLKYFFSLAGGFNLMRRAIRSAVTTTKELDAAMTQTAVVSTYTVSDMWKTLPKYSKEASKLGVAIKDVYNAQTLYVQQGLDMNTAMDIGVETMKMARVAGIGAEEATNSMTAALRGFNMAIDEKSAQRINDVYSKLAQNTASNTQEISTAMTKTAALANSANMSFENTAAFLATIIESTREGAETAGTALKTVIARFTEVKSLYTKNQLTGTDEEGQEIDVNKISKALRTAGINMNEFFTGAKGLDEIFKELGSKWNNLSTVQQRYIATQAAGSRQQSRFLALMQNYERTVELTEMAYNSAGSGQEQFEKTLDSLAAKTEQLKNSWDTLLMGLANSEAIKGIVDFGTDILNVINKIIDALSGSSGLTKALATLSIGMGAFKVGRGAFGKGGLFSYLLGGKEISTRVSRTLIGGIVTSLKTAKTTPELGAALGATINNSLKKNFRFWGRGAEIEGQYFSKDQLEGLKADAKEYQTEINKINDQIKEREGYQEHIRNNSKISEEERERALKFNQKEIDDLNKQKQQTADEFAKKEEEKGFSNSTIKTAMTDPEQIQKATVNYKALGNAVLLAGVGVAAFASYMKNTGKASQEAVASIEALSTGLTTMAIAMKLLQSVGNAIDGLSFLKGGWGMAIAGAVGAIVAIVKVVDALTESAEEKQKRINETISKNQTHIKDLENEYKQVDDSLGSIIQKQEDLNKLTEGTLAWKDAVKELNTEIQTLVQNFPDFLEAVTIGENGQWTIDPEKVRQIQKEKKEEINNSKTAEIALKYTNQLLRIEEIKSKNDFYLSKKSAKNTLTQLEFEGTDTESMARAKRDLAGFTAMDNLLQSFNYDQFSQEKIVGLIEYLKKYPDVIASELPENFKWFGNIVSKNPYFRTYAADAQGRDRPEYTFSTDDYLLQFAQGLLLYKQLSSEGKQIKSDIGSSLVSFLIDNLDEELPQNVYGGAFRQFIYQQAKEAAENIEVKPLNNEEFKDYESRYYDFLGYTLKGTDYYDENNQKVSKPPEEIEQFAAVYDLINNAKSLIAQFKENPTDFTLGKLTLKKYQDYVSEKGTDDIWGKLAKYYVDKFDSFNKLTEELGYGDSFDDTITAAAVSQVESIIREAKNNYGKEVAIDVASFIENLYDGLLDENGILNEDLFTGILSDIESGVIVSLGQLEEISGVTFEGYDFKQIRKYLTKPLTAENWINNFSENFAFLQKLLSGQTIFSEEEQKKLLQTGIYNEENFDKTGGIRNLSGENEEIALEYSNYLAGELNNLIEQIEEAINIKKNFKETKSRITQEGFDYNSTLGRFLTQDSTLTGEEIRKILTEKFKMSAIYNSNSGNVVSLNEIDDDTLKLIYSDLFEPNLYNLETQRELLFKQLKLLNSKEGSLSSETYAKLNSYIQGITKSRGVTRGNSLMSQLLDWNENEIFMLPGADNVNQFPEFLDAIGKLDWSNIDNIEDFQKALKDQGVSLDNASGQLEELFNTFKQIYKLSKIVTADDIKSLTQYGLQLKKEIKNKTDASYTKEQRDYLVNAQRDLIHQFIYNAETGAYTYIGNKKELEKVAQQAAITTGYDQLKAQYIVAQGPDTEGYKEALKALGLTEEDKDEIIGLQNDIDFIRQQFSEAEKVKQYAGLNNDQARMVGASAGVQKAITLQDAQNAGLDINELTNYAQQLSQVNTVLQDTTGKANELAYAIAYDNMLMNKGISELSSNYSNWGKILEKAAEDEKVKSTADYANAIVGLREALQKITGTTVEFSEEFLTAKENLDLFKKAAKGDTDAINQLRKNAAKNILDVNSLGAAGQQLSNWLDGLNLDKIKIGAELDTKVADVFQGLLDAGIMTADQVNQALETIGYEPDVGTETVTVGSGTQTHQNGYTTFTDVNGVTHTVKNEGGMDIAADQQIEVPVIGGSSKAKAMGSSRGAAKFKGGAGSTFNPPPKSGGGGGKKEFKNDFDKYYNQVEDINELIRQRNLLESDYNQLLKAEGTSGADIYKNLQKQLKLIEERRKLTADLAEKRKQQLFETMQADEYKDVAQYAKWNEEDQTIEIDWEAINKIKDSELGNLVKEYIKKLEELQGQYDEQMQLLEELQDLEQEILKERGKEAYKSLEDRVRDALIKQIQDKIDELQAVDEAINETNQKLFDSISQTLELQRQERTNAETEEDLSDKEKRLAYLQQDSSNANAVEIAQLQEELADARQDYTDNLIDQKISELQRQNDEAQEQRQQQIELMQQSLDWQEKNGEFWQQVYSLISDGIGPNGSLVTGSKLDTLLKDGEGWQSLSDFEKMDWLNNLENLIAQAVGFLAHNRQLEDLGVKEGTQITFTNKEGKKLTGTVDKNGNVVVDNGNGTTTTYTGVYQDYAGNYHTVEDTPEPDKTGTETPEKPPEKEIYKYEKYSSKKHWKIKFVEGKEKEKTKEKHTFKDNVCTKCGYKKKKKSGNSGDDETTTVQGGDNGDTYEEKPGGTHETYIDKDGNTHHIYKDADGKIYYSYVEKAGQNKGTTTGGSGGPGRPGGTSTRNFTSFSPDEVLSSRNSDAFMYLTDVYSNAAKSSLAGAMNSGDNYYDIKVQVDSLGSDYDVDKAIDRIKTRIAQENAYRNINTLSRLR